MIRRLSSKLPLQRIAVVPFSGTISRKGIDEYLGLFKALEEAKNIKGVMVEMESPGGTAVASEILFDRLRRLNDKKPLYCYVLLAASGGYMAALGARKICAPSTALIGSIGVISVKPVLRELMEKSGIRLEVMKKGAMKDMSLFHRESTEEERRSMEAINEAVYARFIDLVSERRGIGADEVRALATGELFTAARARELGLIDRVLDYDSFLDELSSEAGVKSQRAVTVRPRRSFFRWLLSETVEAVAEGLSRRL